MPGHPVLHIYCATCAEWRKLPARKEWDRLLRDQLLARLRCSVCKQRPVDIRRGWDVS